MKITEIILKVAFVAGAVTFFVSQDLFMMYFASFLLVCILLGITLIFNKAQSYGYKLAKKEVIMRKVEGSVLLLFAIAFGILRFINLM